MNRSILIVICDFLLVSLLVFGCFPRLLTEKISPSAQRIVEMVNPVANASTATAAVDLRK